MSHKTPVNFIGHGDCIQPNLSEDTEHPAYNRLQQIGQEIAITLFPKAIVAVSSYWKGEEERSSFEDFGFLERFFKFNFPFAGSNSIPDSIIKMLQDAGIEAEGKERGLDHGVWVPFLSISISPDENPLREPIIQISQFETEDAENHYRLDKSLAALYIIPFDHKLKDGVAANSNELKERMTDLLEKDAAHSAHPTLEHLLPLYVVSGATDSDKGEQSWTMPQASINWAQYRFGDLPHPRLRSDM
ncbi:hypothetical protein K432DRAFT_432058 [Lepidopterella palustris CBS 459.81]|uniref:Extradiol ring-cleavage dioxygenase class III enzyme subunit B domain-containing protein n=1 Tax=Lepidopterella palustris CBS 459.81 TaxID=1314670 RepID=A0A8E2EJ68_9PEZI|nr:hypothetical protein K432DRAFT_432058 [Lepidopterella palustris CBS 459.81]